MSIINLFGEKARTLDGAALVQKMPEVEIFVRGFDITLSTISESGEYKLDIRSNGTNWEFPAEEYQSISLTKSENQYNLTKIPLARIAHDHRYSRIAFGVVGHDNSELWGDARPPFRQKELSVAVYIRDEKGREVLWSCSGIRPKPVYPTVGIRECGV